MTHASSPAAAPKPKVRSEQRRGLLPRPARLSEAANTFLTLAESAQEDILALFQQQDKHNHVQIESKLLVMRRRVEGIRGLASRQNAEAIGQAFASYESAVRTKMASAAAPDETLVKTFDQLRSTVEGIHRVAARSARLNTRAIYVLTIAVSWLGSWLFAGSIGATFHAKVVTAIVDRLPQGIRTFVDDTSTLDSIPLPTVQACTPADRATVTRLDKDPTVGCVEWDVAAWRPDLQGGVELVPTFDPAAQLRNFGRIPVSEHGGNHKSVNVQNGGKLSSLCVCGMERGDRIRFVTWYDIGANPPRFASAKAFAPNKGAADCESACRR